MSVGEILDMVRGFQRRVTARLMLEGIRENLLDPIVVPECPPNAFYVMHGTSQIFLPFNWCPTDLEHEMYP